MKELDKWSKSPTYWLEVNLHVTTHGREKVYAVKLGHRLKKAPSTDIFGQLDYCFVNTHTKRYLVLHLTLEQLTYVSEHTHGEHSLVSTFDLGEIT